MEKNTWQIQNEFAERVGAEPVPLRFGLPDDRVHSPNEKFGLDCLHHGARTAAALYERLARLNTTH